MAAYTLSSGAIVTWLWIFPRWPFAEMGSHFILPLPSSSSHTHIPSHTHTLSHTPSLHTVTGPILLASLSQSLLIKMPVGSLLPFSYSLYAWNEGTRRLNNIPTTFCFNLNTNGGQIVWVLEQYQTGLAYHIPSPFESYPLSIVFWNHAWVVDYRNP